MSASLRNCVCEESRCNIVVVRLSVGSLICSTTIQDSSWKESMIVTCTIVHFVHSTIQFSYLVKLFYKSVFGSAFVALNNFKYVYSAINERDTKSYSPLINKLNICYAEIPIKENKINLGIKSLPIPMQTNCLFQLRGISNPTGLNAFDEHFRSESHLIFFVIFHVIACCERST